MERHQVATRIETNRYTQSWRAFGASVPRPRAILVISAHWYINATAVTTMLGPRTIHDFYGFPRELFDVRYDAPGLPELAEEVSDVVAPTAVGVDVDSWGIDHGTWSVLVHAFPDADIPVVQHFIPILYLAGLASAGSATTDVLVDGYAYGSLSMASYVLDPPPQPQHPKTPAHRSPDTGPRRVHARAGCPARDGVPYCASAHGLLPRLERPTTMGDGPGTAGGSRRSMPTAAGASVVLRSAMTPATRTVGYYARSWRRYLSGNNPGDLPVARPTVSLASEAFRDEIVLGVFRMLRPGAQPESLDRVEREVAQAVELYERSGWCDDPRGFFTTPPPLREVDAQQVQARRPYQRISFLSKYQPNPGEPGAQRWSGYLVNGRAHAWMLRHPEPRPWLVAVHGAGMGRHPALDMALFRAHELHRTLGLNVLLPVLPLHGPRREGLDRDIAFPVQDVLDNVHGTAQAVWDIRRLISWIRLQDGEDIPIGLNSISLGGYITALVASLEPGLTCAILGVPVADLVDLVDRHAGPAPTDQQWRTVELAKKLSAVVSPLNLTPQVPPEGRFIYAGVADRVVHPRYQVARLWEHWGRPQIEWYQGGHTGFFRSRPVHDFVESALRSSGLVQPASAPAR